MAAFNFPQFLEETGVSLHRLATYLQVAEGYLAAAAAGAGRLTRRDEAACRQLRRRLLKWKQLALPFAEPAHTFTWEHARRRARERAVAARPAPTEAGLPARARSQPSPQAHLLFPSPD